MITAKTENNEITVTIKGHGDIILKELYSIFNSILISIINEEDISKEEAIAILIAEEIDFCNEYENFES